MARRAWVLVCLLVLAGCQRDFSLPSAKALALSPQAPSVAPLEHVAFTASNGTSPYAFEIASDGSGGATIDAKTGAYVAGPSGPAADVVRVTDASGQSVTARVAVGPRLVVTPTIAFAAPGGTVLLTPSGGKPPYQVGARDAPSGGAVDPDGVTWHVGATGGGTDVLDVGDAVGAVVTVHVHVGAALTLLPTRAPTVAPRETLALVATGGQPPYGYTVKKTHSAPPPGTPGAAPTVALTGMYQAGSVGNVTDTVEVTDANGATADVDVAVTAALTARLERADLRPGEPVRVLASGGKPPYAFRFATRKDHSGGTLDPIVGVYTPGWAYHVTDGIEVVDSLGVVASPPPSIVGAPVLAGAWARAYGVADLDGNGLTDLLVADGGASTLRTYLMQPGAPPIEKDYAIPTYVGRIATRPGLDLNADGRQDLVIEQGADIAMWLPSPGGALVEHAALPRFWNGPELDAIGTGYGSGTVFTTTYSCPGLASIDWPAGASGPNAPVCLPAHAGLDIMTPNWRAAFVDADGVPDLVWATGSEIDVAYGPSYNIGRRRPLPDPVVPGLRPAVVRIGGTTASPQQEAVFTLVTRSDGSTAVTGLADDALIPEMVVPGLTDPTRARLAEVPSPANGQGTVVVWDRLSRDLVSIGRDENGTLWTHTAPDALPSAAFDVALGGDANGDGVPDLAVLGPQAGQVSLLWGEGHGGYGTRARVAGVGTPLLADLDGDGLTDVVGQDGSMLSIADGTADGPAFEPKIEVPLPDHPLAAADLDGDGTPELLYAVPGDGVWSLGRDATGTFSKAVRLGASGVELATALSPAHLGGDAPGDDLLATTFDGARYHAAAIVRDAAGPTTLPVPDPPSLSCVDFVPHDVDGGGLSDVLLSCVDPSGTTPGAILEVALATVSAGRVTGFGAPSLLVSEPLAFGFFRPAGRFGTTDAFVADGQASGTSLVVLVSGSAYTEVTLAHATASAAIGDLDGDGAVDLVSMDPEGGVHVLIDVASQLGTDLLSTYAGGTIVGLVSRGVGAFPDLLLKAGGDLVVLKNDGTGFLE